MLELKGKQAASLTQSKSGLVRQKSCSVLLCTQCSVTLGDLARGLIGGRADCASGGGLVATTTRLATTVKMVIIFLGCAAVCMGATCTVLLALL